MGNKPKTRMCCVCRQTFTKGELWRIVRLPEGNVIIDETQKASGRGAYLCKDIECIKQAKKRKSLERSLSCKIPEQVIETLEASCH